MPIFLGLPCEAFLRDFCEFRGVYELPRGQKKPTQIACPPSSETTMPLASLMGIAGGELLIPTPVLLIGLDHKLAGFARSVEA